MDKTIFVKEGPDKRGRTYIIEGWDKGNNVLSVKRFICEVQRQESEEETQCVADLLVKKLNQQ